MEQIEAPEREFDVWWRQSGPAEWVAVLVDRETGDRFEARTLKELQLVLTSAPSGAEETSSGGLDLDPPSDAPDGGG